MLSRECKAKTIHCPGSLAENQLIHHIAILYKHSIISQRPARPTRIVINSQCSGAYDFPRNVIDNLHSIIMMALKKGRRNNLNFYDNAHCVHPRSEYQDSDWVRHFPISDPFLHAHHHINQCSDL